MSHHLQRLLNPNNPPCKSIRQLQLPFEAIPGPKLSLPFIGTNWIYLPIVGRYGSKKIHEANLQKYRDYGPIMKEEYQRGYPIITVFKPSDIKQVLLREGTCPSRPVSPFIIKHRQSDLTRYPNVGLANMMGREWFELRSQLAPLFLSRDLKELHVHSQNSVSNSLVKYISSLLPATDGLVTNVQEVFYRFSMESIMNLCLNEQLGCLQTNVKGCATGSGDADIRDSEHIFKAAMDLFEAQHKLHYGISFWKYFATPAYQLLTNSQNLIHDISSKYIDEALLKLREGAKKSTSAKCGSLLKKLYEINKFSDLEIKSIIVDFISGGIYTVANTLTMTLFLIAANPHVQDKLYQEIDQISVNSEKEGDIYFDLDKLNELKYLKLCLKESYRLLPTIPGIARTLQTDLALSNYLIPQNSLVFCNFLVSSRLPQYFDDPDEFKPDRWTRTGKNMGDIAFSMLPFGHGVRKCIGHNFAELEIYLALAKLIKKFEIQTINGEDTKSLELSYKFIIVPKKPVTLKFKPR